MIWQLEIMMTYKQWKSKTDGSSMKLPDNKVGDVAMWGYLSTSLQVASI